MALRPLVLFASSLVVAACGDSSNSASDGARSVDAGTDVGPSTATKPCRGGGVRGTRLGEPIPDELIRLAGAGGGRVYWVNVLNDVWSMSSADGSDRRRLVPGDPSHVPRVTIGGDAVYVGLTPVSSESATRYVRLPLDGGPSSDVPLTGQLFGLDTDNYYVKLYATGDVARIPKSGGAPVVLASNAGLRSAKLGGPTLWIDRAGGLEWIDAHGTPPLVATPVGGACSDLHTSETHAVCDWDGSLAAASRETSLQILIGGPTGSLDRSARFLLHGTVARGGLDGVLFRLRSDSELPASLSWIDLIGGRPVEVACTENGNVPVTDGTSFFVGDVDDVDRHPGVPLPIYILRVDLH